MALVGDYASGDVGVASENPAGSAEQTAEGAFTIRASGGDIFQARDEFHFLHRPLAGNGDTVVKIESLEQTHEWAKAGLMFRESLEAGSRHAFLSISAGAASEIQTRERLGADGRSFAHDKEIHAPVWLKITRRGDTFTMFVSADGTNWTQRDQPVTMRLPELLHAGVAVTSHEAKTATTAKISGLKIESR